MTSTIYLIRHGETDWNLAGRWQGHADVPLNDLGLRQARLLAQRLQSEQIQFNAIYSSDLARAYQTAWELGSAVRVPVQLYPPLREIDIGAWSGLHYDQIREQFPIEAKLLEEGQDIPRGGGETLSALRKRVVEAVEAIIAHRDGETIALVTHGGCIRMLLAHVESYHGDGFKRFPHIGNTSISIVRCGKSSWEALDINDMRHLEELHEADLASSPPDDAERPAL
ncbi:histidine phosphatase family protein [Oscillochloris sp. ZM17-4]|uniref:histidine phosphatase family protein n=1 Tax=Oscillochloris sp. ZM17-4 TaxID=2866714 RepID=UPI001C72A826|nr:histidine phosphatase family protein [Oscillochloris sp. ZM17-4]MBX0327105.1 histidine phosphatase family protein [Oscillochloris sp. ZM17-4]